MMIGLRIWVLDPYCIALHDEWSQNLGFDPYCIALHGDWFQNPYCIALISSQSLNFGGRRGTTDDVATMPFHPSLSSAALRESPNPIPIHSLMLSSHLFYCLPLFLAPFTIPCRIVFAMPEDLEMWPYHLSFRFFTMVALLSMMIITMMIGQRLWV